MYNFGMARSIRKARQEEEDDDTVHFFITVDLEDNSIIQVTEETEEDEFDRQWDDQTSPATYLIKDGFGDEEPPTVPRIVIEGVELDSTRVVEET